MINMVRVNKTIGIHKYLNPPKINKIFIKKISVEFLKIEIYTTGVFEFYKIKNMKLAYYLLNMIKQMI